jgi:hypothetical protein
MRHLPYLLVVCVACSGSSGSGKNAGSHIALPQVYPPIRASTPSSLIADPKFQGTGQSKSGLTGSGAGGDGAGGMTAFVPPAGNGGHGDLDMHGAGSGGHGDLGPMAVPMMAGSGGVGDLGAMTGVTTVGAPGPSAINLALAVQERLYSAGPTEILRLVQDLDLRTSQLDTDTTRHACLTAAPITTEFMLPGGVMFSAKFQCIQQSEGKWLAFGFDAAQAADAGSVAIAAGQDFYLADGQEGGMGDVYRISGATGDVEAWISVADSRAPANSQVLIHLLTHRASSTLELTFAGTGVGFCSAHLNTGSDHLFITAKTNAPPPAGTPMSVIGQWCDAVRSGCFASADLSMDLGGSDPSCAALDQHSFEIATTLDASQDAEANVSGPQIYTYFNHMPEGLPAF